MITIDLSEHELTVILYALNRLTSDESAQQDMVEDAEELVSGWGWKLLADTVGKDEEE